MRTIISICAFVVVAGAVFEIFTKGFDVWAFCAGVWAFIAGWEVRDNAR